ncbi:hypothetical protein [Arthrobacter sp. P2b]|uniref:hypothetical protein n=1 Tax=Arthrobacter sp. P2b TaxID=1938741 RepID=UPI0009A8386F|nr:hypothetical protein [Arthrobacter sp. P2b]SLJ93176.1 hypothetical protein SAMN06272721_101601 [Arthrobacter sp. P2b]
MSQRTATSIPPLPASPPEGEGSKPAAVRLFAGFAGFGAGTVNLAISSSFFALGAEGPGAVGYAAGGLAGLWGAGLLAASVVFLARGSVPGGRAAGWTLVAAAGVHVAAILLSTPGTSGLNLSQAAALLLTLMIIAALAWLRRTSVQLRVPLAGAVPTGKPGRLLLAAFAGAVVVAGITTPGLAASTAGQFAVPHGEHGGAPATGGHHQR